METVPILKFLDKFINYNKIAFRKLIEKKNTVRQCLIITGTKVLFDPKYKEQGKQ